jgi:hypothetical protein
MLAKYISKTFFVSGVFPKTSFSMSFLNDNLSEMRVFLLSESSGLQRKHPPPTRSPRSVQQVGQQGLFSALTSEFDYGFEAVRIRVKAPTSVPTLNNSVWQASRRTTETILRKEKPSSTV